ncbi:mobilization protein, partial [Acinetobacter baumannii]|nr:mobilization protein [Acinetobacter baumannii]
IDYLLGEDREREHAQVLSGDVELTAQLIDSSPFAKKYTSGCLYFYEHDLSNEDKQKIMQNFEECLFPG